MGNGVNEDHWDATGNGAEMKLSKTLEPLEPIKHKINVIHGLFQKRAMGQGIHPAQTGCLLSGSQIQKGAVIKAGITVDQVIANKVGQETAQPSIVLACEQPMTGFHETNFSMAYSSHVSWQSPDSPVPNEVYPSLAWDNLFENRGSLRNMSILDRVKDDASALTRQISRYGWRLMATALQTACEHGALHQRANPQAAALWQWRAHTLRELASRETVPPGDRPRAES